ncbi:hypothetical protein [Pseudohalocynthiibacter sp. F2068]|jgi:hypothetical protein|uniref:hypothetical protein n=1 Tax=Pseudohalocynthiibacter sp. F2068 TaxID=2926418 RepID=UPI001FF20E8D|nr:hypothetical protein [Pseudohalocynthiibacter sp. F2068]MCK0104485.1 hypothetical protein [Pseudohalocynthiibacter sp. F2068]
MSAEVSRRTGWKPIPLALKILSVVMVVWALGSAMNLPNLMENGLPVLGIFVFGIGAFLVVLFLDFIGPAIFFYALWNGKPWGVKWAFFYIGLFILNGIVALLTVSDRLGLAQILVPNLVSLLFLAVIFWKRSYFTNAD